MPVVMGGGHPDLSYIQILRIIKDRIKAAWTETNPPVTDPEPLNNVVFNHDWFDDSHEFSVSIIHNTSSRGLLALGKTSYDYSMFIEIHVWCKQISEDHPIIAGNIEKEISRIIMTNIADFGSGISLVLPTEFTRVDEEDNTSTIWHSFMTCQVVFVKFIVP